MHTHTTSTAGPHSAWRPRLQWLATGMSESLGATRSRTTAFGAALRSMRLAAGLSQGALAERAGLSEKAVGALERGDRTTPRPATIVSLADAVGATPAERDRLLAAAHAEERPTDRGRPTDT